MRPAAAIAVAALAVLAGCDDGGGEGRSPAAPAGIVTPGGVEMVRIPAGEFLMGSDAGAPDERPVRRVRVEAFYMDRTEVTQAAFRKVMGANPARHKGPDLPVEQLSWSYAVRYCNARSLLEGLTPCYDLAAGTCDRTADGYRLPTEAEWEYACRAGATGPWGFGADQRRLPAHAWYAGNAARTTHPVGRKRPNRWGLCDMHGNVAEWCDDAYAPYGGSAPTPPERVLRGGSFRSPAARCRSAARDSEPPGLADVCFGYDAYGFRCVRRAPPAGAPVSRPGPSSGRR